MPNVLLWGRDDTNKVWIPLQVDASGYVKVDMSNINLDDLGDVDVPAPADDDLLYYDDATGLWKSRTLVLGDMPAGIYRVAATFVVAAIDSVDPTRADYECPGANDHIKLQEAVDDLPI